MTLTERLHSVGSAFNALGIPSTHYWHPVKDAPLLIWAEDGSVGFHSDNRTAEQMVTGTVDYFTHTEFDTNIDSIQTMLDGFMSSWSLNSVQYEEETNLIHYEWEWVL